MQLLEMHMVEPLIRDGEFISHIKDIVRKCRPLKRFTVIIFGSKEYFAVK
jgi:hypothetical protein